MEQHLQQQQQQQQGGEFEEDDTEDDSRFEVPTEAVAVAEAVVGPSIGGGGGGAADAINVAPSVPSSTNATTNYGEGLLSDLAVEDRIK